MYGALIKFLCLKGKSLIKINSELVSFSIVKIAKFKHGRVFLTKNVWDIRKQPQLIKITEAERLYAILHEHLDMRKLGVRWVPRLLRVDQSLDISQVCRERFKRNANDFMRRFVTDDESWFNHYALNTKQQSMQCIINWEPASQKSKTVPSTEKVMPIVFFLIVAG